LQSKTLVSAIIPTYNRADTICQAVDSVLQQTYPRVEVLVVDDGSTDDTLSRLERYGDRIQVIAQANAGPGAARNRGIELSHGEVLAFLDSDDLWFPTKIERQVALLEKVDESVPCCLCNAVLRFSDGRELLSFDRGRLCPQYEEGIWLNAAEVLASRFVMFNQMVAIRRTALVKVGGFNEGFRCLEDYELALRLALLGPWAFIRTPLACWNEGSTGSLAREAHTQKDRLRQNEQRIREMLLATLEESGRHQEFKRLMQWELKRVGREIKAARVQQQRAFGAEALGGLLLGFEHYRDALFARTPWFPKMETAEVNGWVPAKAS
jgi:glycosyltransferase involved in cell wall biosynthesis